MQKVATPYPSYIVPPTVSGQAKTTFTLTCDPGVWHAGYGISFAYQWIRGASTNVGTNSPTYTVVVADEGSKLRCQVTATNLFGSRIGLSAQTATVIP